MSIFKLKADKLLIEEIEEAERNLLIATIAQQKAVAEITKSEAHLMIKNAELSYYKGLVTSLKGMRGISTGDS